VLLLIPKRPICEFLAWSKELLEFLFKKKMFGCDSFKRKGGTLFKFFFVEEEILLKARSLPHIKKNFTLDKDTNEHKMSH
jgi:hypothetical protein